MASARCRASGRWSRGAGVHKQVRPHDGEVQQVDANLFILGGSWWLREVLYDEVTLLPQGLAMGCNGLRLCRRQEVRPVQGTNALAKQVQLAGRLSPFGLLHPLAKPLRQARLERQALGQGDAVFEDIVRLCIVALPQLFLSVLKGSPGFLCLLAYLVEHEPSAHKHSKE